MQMQDLDDIELLREYTERDSETAFAEIVARHLNKVYSVAWRHTGNPHAAEEITQAVFVILATKAGRLNRRVILSGWLYETARLTALTYIRSEIRRTHREEAHMQSILNESESEVWTQISPLLDAAMAKLNETDRHAIVLRYFDGKSMKEVGAALGANEDAAKKRVSRALEKLRKSFTKRGVVSTTVIIAGAISANSVQAAPAAFAKTVTAVAIAKGAAASASTLTLIKGALKLMAWTNTKTTVVVGVGILLAVGTTITVKESQKDKTYSWQVFDPKSVESLLETTPPQVAIVPTKFPRGSTKSGGTGNWSWTFIGPDGRVMGMNCTAEEIVRYAYSTNSDFLPKGRLMMATNLPNQDYDFIANLKSDVKTGLQLEIRKKLGLAGHFERRTADVLALEETNQSGLKAATMLNGVLTIGEGNHWIPHQTSLSGLAEKLEHYLQIPVVDITKITNHFDLSLRWQSTDANSAEK
jgi:uncharacterized protein (TIGR03435 family)